MIMIKKLALLAAAGLLYIAVPTAPASAQGINVQIGGGHHGGYGRHHGYGGHRGYNRGPGYRARAYAPRHGYRHGGRTKTIIVR
jgi:Spy/CpxP family protein refolding chaperone